MEISPLVIGLIAGAIYAASAYLKKSEGQAPELFDGVKFGATVLTGAIVGLVLGNLGIEITEGTLIVQLGLYAGVTVIIENILRAIYRRVQKTKKP